MKKVVLALAILILPLQVRAQTENIVIHHDTVVLLGQAIRKNLHDGGIFLAARAMASCYTTFLKDPAAMRACAVWDLALMMLDHSMREMFTGEGVQPGAPPPQLTPEAFADRQDTFWRMAFPGGAEQAREYIGGAPSEVLQIATQQ